MPGSVDSEIQNDYESRTRKMIPSVLYKCFNMVVYDSKEGKHRKFTSEDLGAPWPDNVPEPVEIDVLARCNSVKGLRSGRFQHPENKYVMGSVSRLKFHENYVSSSSYIPHHSGSRVPFDSESSPSAADAANNNDSSNAMVDDPPPVDSTPDPRVAYFVIGEVTYGGRESVFEKIYQLEKDCAICMAKSPQASNVLQAVGLAILINQNDHINAVFDKIAKDAKHYPYVNQLYRSGRFMYLQYTETHLAKINAMEGQMQQVVESVGELSENVISMDDRLSALSGDVGSLRAEMNQLSSSVQTILQLLLEKKQGSAA